MICLIRNVDEHEHARPPLIPTLLRTFAYIAEEGSFTRAAEHVGRNPIRCLDAGAGGWEALLGQTLLLRGKGGSVHLTSHGRYLLERSRALLAVTTRSGARSIPPWSRATVRLGSPGPDYAMRYLPAVLRRFSASHPAVDVDVICAPSNEIVERLKRGELDLTLCSDGHAPPGWPTTPLWRGPLLWVTSDRYAPAPAGPAAAGAGRGQQPLHLAAQRARRSAQGRAALPGRVYGRRRRRGPSPRLRPGSPSRCPTSRHCPRGCG